MKSSFLTRTMFATGLGLAWLIAPCEAHFLWLVPKNPSCSEVESCFNEGPTQEDPKLIQRFDGLPIQTWIETDKSIDKRLVLSADKSSVQAIHSGSSAWTLEHDYGVVERGGTSFLLKYHAMALICQPQGKEEGDRIQVSAGGITFVPSLRAKTLSVKILKKNEVFPNATLECQQQGQTRTAVTDAQGIATFDTVDSGMCAIKLKGTEAIEGNLDGKAYSEIRTYATACFFVPKLDQFAIDTALSDQIPPLANAVTSFGSAATDDAIYVYGGNIGSAHTYYAGQQDNQLFRLSMGKHDRWEMLGQGPSVQGNALVGDDEQVVLIGGFVATNKKGDTPNLVSQKSVRRFDLKTHRWTDWPDLPEGRSSLDATLYHREIYVIGGWNLAGDSDEATWHATAWKLSMERPNAGWQSLAPPPFQRRALAVIAYRDRIYAIGGMDPQGTTTACAVYDPATDRWDDITPMIGLPIHGFGAAAVVWRDQLLVSDSGGNIQRLRPEDQSWELVASYDPGRFFHRMLPFGQDGIAILGGANMSSGRFATTQIFRPK